MSLSWLNVAAFWGLALLAIPIAIHLLVRQQARTVRYPSLRFVRETALAAFRRRTIQDALLLACRVAIIAAAVAALAGPILQTDARTAAYAARTSRAVVQLDDSAANLQEDAFRSRTFRRPSLTDALIDAVRWLNEQPPSSREIVVSGSLWRGQVARGDLDVVPAEIGIRFERAQTASPPPDQFTQRILTRRNDRLVFATRQVRLGADVTSVVSGDVVDAPADAISVVAAAEDQPLADAALTAALDEGLRWPDPQRRLVVLWNGANEQTPPGEVLRMEVPQPPSTAGRAIWNLLDHATPRAAIEPLAIADVDLAAWSRPPQGVSTDARPSDEGDRRWLWVLALILLGIEHVLRRDRSRWQSLEQERHAA